MKLKIFLGLTLCLLLFLIIGINSSSNQRANNYRSETPETALHSFWKASFDGNQTGVNEISSIPKEDWLGDCIGNSDVVQNVLLKSDEEAFNAQVDTPNIVKKESFEVSFDGENIPSNIKIFSKYLFASKVAWNRFKIVEKKSYKDEVLLIVEIAEYPKNFNNSEKFAFAFKHIASEWKIIGVVQMNVFNFVDNQIKFGSFRPNCAEN